MTRARRMLRLAAIGDTHFTKSSQGRLADLIRFVNDVADVLLLCGDLTDYGLPEEAAVLAHELSSVRVPMVAVLGNHDFESGHEDVVRDRLMQVGVQVLDGTSCEINEVEFIGVKGFGGGFGRRAVQAWGERGIKRFVHEATDEALKLERALCRSQTAQKVVLLHYAPIAATVEGEPFEIYPFLGSSRLEEPINRYGASLVFHGHAHGGSGEGKTCDGVPVFNVAMPLLRRTQPDKMPCRLVELPLGVRSAVHH